MSFCIELFCVVTLQYQILVRIAIAYFIIEKKKAAPQPWQAIAQRFCSMLDNLDMYRNEKLLKLAHEICRWHHERYDGKGYPDGLVGEEIPISAQVVSLADVYDALVSERVYKKAFSHEKALEMIQNGECGTFNPLLLQCMTEAQDKLKTMMEVAEKE